MSTLRFAIVPPSPGLFRWQRIRTLAKLPAPLRALAPPLSAGESYWLALGGLDGFSAATIHYPHRLASAVEVPLGDEADDGLTLRFAHLAAFWSTGVCWFATVPDVHLQFGRWETAPDGSPRWVVGHQNVYAVSLIEVPPSSLVDATHMRVVEAGIMPQVAAVGTQAPSFEPVFACSLAVLEMS